MAREATSPELAQFRGDEQWSRLFLAIQPATVIYTARVNQTFDSHDRLTQLTYDAGSGTLANVLNGMTMWLGSSAGAYDRGIARIRKTPTSTVFYIGENSELVELADNDFITIIDVFGPWQKNLITSGNSVKMDYDLDFPVATGGYAPPVPIMGPVAAVLRRTGATVDFSPPSSAASYSQISSIASVLHAFPGASATSGLTTNTPTATYNADGCFRRDLTVTDANGNSTQGHRVVFVNPTSPAFKMISSSGDFDTGDWSVEIECFAGVDISTVYDMAMVVLWARDRYGQTEVSIGPVAGHENILNIGWIGGETIEWNAEKTKVTFTIYGPQHWIDLEDSYPTGLIENATPTKWTHFPTLTVDDMLFHVIMWRSTLATIMDCFLTGDTKRMRKINLPYGSLWTQIRAICYDTIWAFPTVNCLGQLYIQIDLNLLPTASRSSIPVVQLITKADCIGNIRLIRHQHNRERNLVEISGVKSYNGTVATPLFARAPGNTPARFGKPETPSNHLFVDQDDANRIAGGLYAEANVPYEVEFQLTNQRLIDICPHQYLTHTIISVDTIRGITMTTQKFIPRRVERKHDEKTGLLTVSVFCVQETTGVPGVRYFPPQYITPSLPPPPPVTNLPPIDIGDGTIPPPFVPPPPGDTGDCSGTDLDSPGGTFILTWDKTVLDGSGTFEERHAFAWFPVSLRPSSAAFPTFFGMNWTCYAQENFDTVWSHLHVYAVDSAGTRLLTATPSASPYIWSLTTVSALPVAGFEVELDALADSDFSISQGSARSVFGPSAQDSDGDLVSASGGGLTPGNFYWMEYHVEGWREATAQPFRTDIEFGLDGIWSGHLGHNGSSMFLIMPNGIPMSQAGHSGTNWGHYVFKYPAGSPEFRQRVYSTSFGDNINVNGGMLTELFNASLTGNRIVYLGETYIQSPCGTV